jgi:hypothetical protein
LKRTFLHFIFSIYVCISLSSCDGKSKEDENKEKESAKISTLALKYHAEIYWDTTKMQTFEFQEKFIDTKKPILFKGRIYDIIKKDSTCILKVLDEREDSDRYYLAFISTTKQQFNKIKGNYEWRSGAFVIEVSKVHSPEPQVIEDVYQEPNDESDTKYEHLSEDGNSIISVFEGKLINFYLPQNESN